MVGRQEFDALLDKLACELPQEFYRHLNGVIIVLDGAKPHPDSPDMGLFVFGEYRHERAIGRYIAIYYGSFMALYPRHTPEQLEPLLRSTLRHEFRHHLESLAGVTALADEDRVKIEKWLAAGAKEERRGAGSR